MKSKRRFPGAMWPTALIACLCFVHIGVVRGEFCASVAVREVTPTAPVRVSGGIGPSNPAEKKIGELTVRALVLENGTTRVAICSTDFLGFPGVLCNRVRARVSGIPPKNISGRNDRGDFY